MNNNTFRKLCFILSTLAVLGLVSCQKGSDPEVLTPIPGEVKDSTLLIKRLSYAYELGTSSEDSVVESYSYDTVNRKITLTWHDATEVYMPDGTKAEFSYNNRGLLTQLNYIYPPGYNPLDYDYMEINFSYDTENILQKIEAEEHDGHRHTRAFTKTKLSSGNYQLTWIENDGFFVADDNDSTFRRAEFDKDNNPVVNYTEHFLFASASDPSPVKITIVDSLSYDASGSVVKISRKVENDEANTSESFTMYEYTRQTKGNELYGQRQVLLNGIANIPFNDYDNIVADAFGILSFSLDYEAQLFSRYVASAVKAHMYDGSLRSFTASSTFDIKNRLVKFTGFLHDLDLYPREYRIGYYK